MRGGERNRQTDPAKDRRPALQQDIADLVEYRLALLEEDLRLSPGQQIAWQSYAGKMQALASDISRERNRGQPDAPTNALQQIDHATDVARNRLTALEDISAAARVLYEGLTPQQKSLVDSRLSTIIMPLTTGGMPGNAANTAERTGRQ